MEEWMNSLDMKINEFVDHILVNRNTNTEHDQRFEMIETALKDHLSALDTHQIDIDHLKKQMLAMASPEANADGSIDGTALLRKIHFIEQELNEKADKTEVVEARSAAVEGIHHASTKLEKALDILRGEVSNFREDYHMFRSKDYASLEERVEALEKRSEALAKSVAGISMPEY